MAVIDLFTKSERPPPPPRKTIGSIIAAHRSVAADRLAGEWKIRFAIFPRRVNGKTVWLNNYLWRSNGNNRL